MNNTNKDVLTKNVLTAALNDYLLHIQIDPLGDVTSQVNAAKALINYISTNDDITADWVKSNWIILLPAIDYHRNSLKESIHNAILDNDEEALSKASEYSCAVTPQVRQTGNRLSGLAGTAYASLLT